MDYVKFCDKLEKIKSTVATEEGSGRMSTDVFKLRSALKEMKEYMNLVGRLRPMDYVKIAEKHDINEVMKKLDDAHVFVKDLNKHLNELQEASVVKLISRNNN